MFVLYAATSLELREFDAAHETFIYKHWDHDATFQDILSGRPSGGVLVVPTMVDPSLAPPGQHLICYASLAPYNVGQPWQQAKERYTELILDECEKVFPGLRHHLTFTERGTPLTLERYTTNHRGAAYGWANTPTQSASKRLTYQTPINGLYLSSHWAQAASGLRVIVSGTHTAQMILRNAGLAEVGPTF
jgi:prolycopene isomerase